MRNSLILALILAPSLALAQAVYSGKADPNAHSNVPSNNIGVESSYYLDQFTGNMYGPKTGGIWPSAPVANFGGSINIAGVPNVQAGDPIPTTGAVYINSSGFLAIAQ